MAQATRETLGKKKGTPFGKITFRSIGLLFLVLLFLFIALPTVVLVFFGMLPTLVASFIDRTRDKAAALCVGAMNFCGIFPFLLILWKDVHTFDKATEILMNVFNVFIMYGAAALGWLIFMYVPPCIMAMFHIFDQRQLRVLRKKQEKLVEEWGEDVTQTKKTP